MRDKVVVKEGRGARGAEGVGGALEENGGFLRVLEVDGLSDSEIMLWLTLSRKCTKAD